MKRLSLVVLICVVVFAAFAQHVNKHPKEVTKTDGGTQRKYPKLIPVTLGRSDVTGGNISKHTFDSLVRQGLHIPDSIGGRVAGFEFNYKERSIMEDSVGRKMLVTELLMEYCMGDTLSEAISYSIYERTKRGDTAYFDDIKVITKEGLEFKGKSMKFVLIK